MRDGFELAHGEGEQQIGPPSGGRAPCSSALCPAWPVPDTERRVHAAPADGTWRAAGSEVDASLRIWDPATAACTNTLDGHYRTAK
ncbi:hypothetical protein [Streptomyces sp. NPDC057301]|uniref:hypothetical protein n=1 Tax=Streptomyces sp. NPDC057301 TaxID=3346093 RepID=UPI00362B7622